MSSIKTETETVAKTAPELVDTVTDNTQSEVTAGWKGANPKDVREARAKQKRLEEESRDKKRLQIAENVVAMYGNLPKWAKPVGNGNWDLSGHGLEGKELLKAKLRQKIRMKNFERTSEEAKDNIVDKVCDKMFEMEIEYEEKLEEEEAKKRQTKNHDKRQKRKEKMRQTMLALDAEREAKKTEKKELIVKESEVMKSEVII